MRGSAFDLALPRSASKSTNTGFPECPFNSGCCCGFCSQHEVDSLCRYVDAATGGASLPSLSALIRFSLVRGGCRKGRLKFAATCYWGTSWPLTSRSLSGSVARATLHAHAHAALGGPMKGIRVYNIEVAVFTDLERCTPSSIADIPARIPLNDTSVKLDAFRGPSTYWSKLASDRSDWKAAPMSEIGVASRAEFDGLLKGIFVYTDREAALNHVRWYCKVAPEPDRHLSPSSRNFIAIAWC